MIVAVVVVDVLLLKSGSGRCAGIDIVVDVLLLVVVDIDVLLLVL